MLNHFVTRFLPNIRNSRTCLKIRTLTPYQNIIQMIAPLTLKKEHNLHLGRSTTWHKTNLQLFVNTLMKPSEGVHLTFQVSSWCLILVCQKERWIFMNVCRLLWMKSTHHQESVPFAPNLRVVEPTLSCQVVHQN